MPSAELDEAIEPDTAPAPARPPPKGRGIAEPPRQSRQRTARQLRTAELPYIFEHKGTLVAGAHRRRGEVMSWSKLGRCLPLG